MKSYKQLRAEYNEMKSQSDSLEATKEDWQKRYKNVEADFIKKEIAYMFAQSAVCNLTHAEISDLGLVKNVIKQHKHMTLENFSVLVEEDFKLIQDQAIARNFPQKNKVGEPIPSHIDNYIHFFRIRGCTFRFNQLLNKVELNGHVITDLDDSVLTNEASRYKLAHKKNLLIDAYTEIAHKNSYHPFKTLVESNPWDGADHIHKDFLTISYVRARGAYNRHDTTGKTICSFVATTNDDYFLKDDTGERRFLVIPVAKLDQDHQVNMQQVFAQAKHLFDQGEKWWFSDTEVELVNGLNRAYQVEHELDALCRFLEPGSHKISSSDLLRLLKGPHSPILQSDRIKLGTILKRKKIKSVRVGPDNTTHYLVDETRFNSIVTPVQLLAKEDK